MEKEILKQFRLGVFVVAGTILFVLTMYFIGRNQNLFGTTIHLVCYFNNINGLQAGNNVRFAGADAGTVESVEVISDTAICVVITLQEKYKVFIKRDAVASIGTDGLMGNKLINIINAEGSKAEIVKNGSIINTLKPVETDEMLRTLNQTNEYVSGIAYNLKYVTEKIGNSRGTLWKLLTDTTLSGRVDSTFIHFQNVGKNISDLSKELTIIVKNAGRGNSMMGILTKDTILSKRLYQLVGSLNAAGEKSAQISNELLSFMKDIDKGQGTLGVLLRDSSLSNDIKTAVRNLKQGSESLNKSMDAIQKIPLLKKYMQKPEKKSKVKNK